MGPKKIKIGHVDRDHAHLGVVSSRGYSINMAYPCTRPEDKTSFSPSKDMKEDTKRENRGDLGSRKVIGNVTVRQNGYDFLFTLYRY